MNITIEAIINQTTEGAHIVDVTPHMAQQLLEISNFDNRNVKNSVVNKYSKLMQSGDWLFSSETIAVSKTGRLLNGQHRLLAVIQSGRSQKFLFATGFDDAVFAVLDRGAVRTASDALRKDKMLIQCATLACRLRGSNTVTDPEIDSMANLIENEHKALINHCNARTKTFSSAPFRLAAVARIKSGADMDYVLGLYRNLALSHCEKLPPVGHALLRAFINGRLSHSSGGQLQLINCCVAWKLFDPASKGISRISVKYSDRSAKEIVSAVGGA